MVETEIAVVLDEKAFIPERAYPYDAGLDLRSPVDKKIERGKSAIIDTGVHIQIPKGYAGEIKSRSGLNIRSGLICEGVIDCGYTGSIVVKIYNLGEADYKVMRGDKIAQLVIKRIITPQPVIVQLFSGSDRGNNGFGSTGR